VLGNILPKDEQKIRLCTRFIPVIIDYGRAYVNCPGIVSSDFINIACETACNDNSRYDPFLEQEFIINKRIVKSPTYDNLQFKNDGYSNLIHVGPGPTILRNPIYNNPLVKDHRERLGLTKKLPYCNLIENGVSIIRDSDNKFREPNYHSFINPIIKDQLKNPDRAIYNEKELLFYNPTYYTSIRTINKSHDLRFIVNLIINKYSKSPKPDIIKQIGTIFNYTNNPEWSENDFYGVKENPNEYIYNGSKNKIKTTSDFYTWLIDYYQINYQNQDNIKDSNIIGLPKINIIIPKEFNSDSTMWSFTQ
jgi:hypothetical protein